MVVATHSTITTSDPGALLRRHECVCGFVLETTANGIGVRLVARGDTTVGHTWDGQLATH